ncbi:MAG TPA: preprotein translocase YidC [Planosporangium sp.]|nr:preprotein translocase YidC [Planosporangium sp.]
MTQEQESRRHGIPEESEVTPATTAETTVEPRRDIGEALAKSDIVTKDDGSGMAGGSSGSSAGGSGFTGHPDAVDPD